MGKKKIDELKDVPSNERTSKEKIASLKETLALVQKMREAAKKAWESYNENK